MWQRMMWEVGLMLVVLLGCNGLLAGTPKIAAGWGHSLAIDTQGRLLAWGDDSHGQLGLGRQLQFNLPVRVQLPGVIVKVACSSDHNLALTADGSLWAWGKNRFGQLGDGTKTERPTPVRVGSGFTAIAVGGEGEAMVDGGVDGRNEYLTAKLVKDNQHGTKVCG